MCEKLKLGHRCDLTQILAKSNTPKMIGAKTAVNKGFQELAITIPMEVPA